MGTATSTVAESDTSTSPTTTITGGAACPNGVLEEGEACDDGNAVEGDGCNNDCVESGTLLGEYRSGETGNDLIRSVAMGPEGKIIVGGSRGGFTRWIGEFDANLVPGWSQVLVGAESETVTSVAVNMDAIYAVGAVGSTNAHDIWVGRFGFDGTLQWEDIAGDDGEDYATQAALTAEGDILVAGLDQVAGPSSLWLRRYSPSGGAMWTSTVPLGTSLKAFPVGPGLAVRSDGVVMGFSSFTPDTVPELLVEFPLAGGDPVSKLRDVIAATRARTRRSACAAPPRSGLRA